MKQPITAVLLPTNEASEIYIFKGIELVLRDKTLRVSDETKKTIEKSNDFINQHLYLYSGSSIKEGDWIYNSKFHSVIKAGNDTLVNCKGIDGSFCSKIEFTTDPELTQCDGKCAKNECVCDLIPAIDGNTKVLVALSKDAQVEGMSKQIQVNFLSEYCKRYNQKDNQKGVDVWKMAKEYVKTLGCLGSEIDNVTSENLVVWGYNQALQSKAGGFSLEEVINIYKEYKKYSKNWEGDEQPFEYWIKDFQSLTPKPISPNGDKGVEMYVEMKEVEVDGISLGTSKTITKIKLNTNGTPIIYFK